MIKVGINGMGRIGRALVRNNLANPVFDLVLINDINPDTANIAYTLNHDTLYGRLPVHFQADGEQLHGSDGSLIPVTHSEDISAVDWQGAGVELLIDASGVYQNVLNARHLITENAVERVLITHSPEPVDFTMVLGANEELFDPERHRLVSSSICDATALAPVLRILEETYGIALGAVTTIHPWLSYQNLVDGPASSWSVPGTIYHHYAMGRTAIGNLIPKPTSALDATLKVLDHVGVTAEAFGSFSYRPPTALVGSADLTIMLKRNVSKAEVIERFELAEREQSRRLIHNNWEPLVSLDFRESDYAAIVDHRWTDVIGGQMLKLVLWYDNEYGYAAKVLDQIRLIVEKTGRS